MEGDCLCKAVKVRVTDDKLLSGERRGYFCHCFNCRKVAGGIFGFNLRIEESKVEFPNGKENVKVFVDTDTLSGTPLNRAFCGTCGCPIFSQTPLFEGMIILKLGIYPTVPEPEWECFAKNRQKWEKPLEGAAQYKDKLMGEKMPDSI